MAIKINLTAQDLFGNDAAEDEVEDVFQSYAVERPEVGAFLDEQRRICIARAYKGEGKSALLRLVRTRLEISEESPLLVRANGKQISPSLTGEDTDAWVREWKKSLLNCVARELGSQIGMAWSDDAISLVEAAEQNGYRSKSIISAIFDRLRTPAVPVQRERGSLVDPERIVQRWAKRGDSIWVFVDDVDENFKNAPTYKAKVAAFFIAAREIVNTIPQIRMRLAVRPNTWTTLSLEYESLSKVEQYTHELRWTEADIRDLISGRIRGYLQRTAQMEMAQRDIGHSPDSLDLISLVFDSPVTWGGRSRPTHVPLATLSRRRPNPTDHFA